MDFIPILSLIAAAFWDQGAGRPVLDVEIGGAVRLTLGGKVVSGRLLG